MKFSKIMIEYLIRILDNKEGMIYLDFRFVVV